MPAHNPTRKLAEYFKTSFVQNKLSASKSTDKANIIGNIGRLFDGDEENECMINAVRLIADELLRVEPNKLTEEILHLYMQKMAEAAYPFFFDINGNLHSDLIAAINSKDANLYSSILSSISAEELHKHILAGYIFKCLPFVNYMGKHKIQSVREDKNHIGFKISNLFAAQNYKFPENLNIAATQDLIKKLEALVAEIQHDIDNFEKNHSNECLSLTKGVPDKYSKELKETSTLLSESLQVLKEKPLYSEHLLVNIKLKISSAFIGLAVTRLEMHPRETDAGTSRFFNKNLPLQGPVSIVDSLKVRKDAIDAKIVCSNKINLKEADFNQLIRPISNIEEPHQRVFKQHIGWFHRFLQLFGFGKKIETENDDLRNTQKQLQHTFIH